MAWVCKTFGVGQKNGKGGVGQNFGVGALGP